MLKKEFLKIFGNKSKFDCAIFLTSVSLCILFFHGIAYLTDRSYVGSGILGFYTGFFIYALIYIKFAKNEKFRNLSGWKWEYFPEIDNYRKLTYLEAVGIEKDAISKVKNTVEIEKESAELNNAIKN